MNGKGSGKGPLVHGGRLRAAARAYGIPLSEWLDLSTGINPRPWPVPELDSTCWQRLPEEDDGLEQAAADYYRGPLPLPVAGSRAAIQALPQLCAPCRVTVIAPGYAEHGHAWEQAGHRVRYCPGAELDGAVADSDVLVVINPNNPSGEHFRIEQLLHWHQVLAARGGWLVVDEAFMDVTPGRSVIPHVGSEGLIVLRSLGKFFGLAGARVGFVFAWPQLLESLRVELGPWTVPGPSREVARRALEDRGWQRATREQLLQEGERLAGLLSGYGLEPSGATALFQWVRTADASRLHEALARQGILTRLFAEPPALRFGLPASEVQWQQLEAALEGAVVGVVRTMEP